jgi:molecular chaperone GrpE
MTEEKSNKEAEVTAEELNQEAPTSSKAEKETLQEEANEDTSKQKKKSKKEKKQDELDELKAKLSEVSDKHLRLQAEFDNFRRRTIKEKADLIKSGGESVLINILPVIDDFERALDSLKDVADDDAGKQGTAIIYNKFEEFLKQNF